MGIGYLFGMASIAMIAATGLLAVKRWSDLKFFPVYALAVSVIQIAGYHPALYTPDAYIVTNVIMQLLCLVAVAQALRWKRVLWLLIPAGLMILSPLLPVELVLKYQLIREALVVALAALIVAAHEHPALKGWALYGGLILASDVAKLVMPDAAWFLLRVADPAAYTLMCAVWLWSLLAPERERWTESLMSGARGLLMPGAARVRRDE